MDLYSGIKIGAKHTYNDWGLFLKKFPIVAPPEPKYTYIEIAGADGDIDLTEALTSEPKYEMRKGEWNLTTMKNRNDWAELCADIENYLQGRKFNIYVADDVGHYYTGRVYLNAFKSNKHTGQLTISYNLEPYRYETNSSLDDWLWDPFDFEDGFIADVNAIELSGIQKTVIVEGLRKTLVPTFIVTTSSSVTVKVQNKFGTSSVKTFSASGSYQDYDLQIAEGQNKIILNGTGTVSIDYRRAKL